MVPDAGKPSSMASADAIAVDLAPAETAPRRALERSLEFFSRKVNIWKRVNLRKWGYTSMVFEWWMYYEIVSYVKPVYPQPVVTAYKPMGQVLWHCKWRSIQIYLIVVNTAMNLNNALCSLSQDYADSRLQPPVSQSVNMSQVVQVCFSCIHPYIHTYFIVTSPVGLFRNNYLIYY